MIDEAMVTTDVGGHLSVKIFDTPNEDCSQLILDCVEQFLKTGGVWDTLKIEIRECDE